jgi:MscS family membrane protein
MRAITTALIVLLAALAQTTAAQIPGLGKADNSAAQEKPDPLGRTSPRGTLVAFSRAVEREDFGLASRYLQLGASQRSHAASLSFAVKNLIDRELHESLSTISDASAGSLEDGLEEDHERIGPLIIDGQKTWITWCACMTRTTVRLADLRGTLRQIPRCRLPPTAPGLKATCRPLLNSGFLGLTLAHWIVLVTLLVGSFSLLALIGMGCNFVAKRVVGPVRTARTGMSGTRHPLACVSVLTILIQFQ